MLRQLANFNGVLYQEYVATHLLHYGDRSLAYYDEDSNVCISKPILAAFLKLTPNLVYERTDKFWRYRLPTDRPGRQQ